MHKFSLHKNNTCIIYTLKTKLSYFFLSSVVNTGDSNSYRRSPANIVGLKEKNSQINRYINTNIAVCYSDSYSLMNCETCLDCMNRFEPAHNCDQLPEQPA